MQLIDTPIADLLVIQPRVFSDARGYFFESFNEKIMKGLGLDTHFVQDNESKSAKNVLRGLHYQVSPYEQGKLVRVIKGKVLDVAVDIRPESSTYGQHFTLELSEENHTMMFIPRGFAHGFLTLEDNTIFSYKCDNYYHKEAERSILWNDADLDINWGIENPILSEKDATAPLFTTLTDSN